MCKKCCRAGKESRIQRFTGVIIAANETLKAGDKVYAVNMKKAIVLFNIGSEPMKHRYEYTWGTY